MTKMKFFGVEQKDDKKAICERDQLSIEEDDEIINSFKSSTLAFNEDQETATEAGVSEKMTNSTVQEANNKRDDISNQSDDIIVVGRNKSERKGRFEIIPILDENIMEIQKDAVVDFYLDDEIVHGVSIEKSVYRYPLIFSGLLKSNAKKVFKVTARHSGGLFQLKWIVLEKKFPFSVINQVIWEFRWVLTYVLTLSMMANYGLQKFLKDLEITQKGWRENKRSMRIYVIAVSLITVVIPTGFVILDLNTWNGSPDMMPVWKNILLGGLMLLHRMLMVPSFCVLTSILKLLGDHIQLVGKRLYKQRTIKEAHKLIRNMRCLIRETEKSLQLIIMVHMFLVFCASFTTTMSTLERLEFSYTSKGNGNANGTTSAIEVHFADQPSTLPVADLIQLKMDFQEMKDHFENASNGEKTRFPEDMITTHGENLNKSYKLIYKVQQQQIKILENLYSSNKKQQNITIQQYQQSKPPSITQVVGSIKNSYKKIRMLLDMFMMLVEILLLYMSPLILIVRTDYFIRENIHDVWDISIDEQIENNFGITTLLMQEHILAHLNDIEGFRVFGYRVDFFKTLILASFGPIIAIAMRAALKHYGIS